MSLLNRFATGAVILLWTASTFAEAPQSTTPAASPSRPLRVVIFDDVGGGGVGPENLARCLAGDGYAVRRVTGEAIRNGVLGNADVLIQPGGSGSKQAATLGETGRANIRNFVKSGGGYVGVCAGAYLATTDYEWSLGILDAKVVDRAHWARGTGDVEVSLSDAGCRFFTVTRDPAKPTVTIYYGQGPLLAPGGRDDVPDYEAVGVYETEIAKKGAPTGVMKGTTAAAMGAYGKGRVFCFSPHPEKTPGLEGYIRAAVTWAGTK